MACMLAGVALCASLPCHVWQLQTPGMKRSFGPGPDCYHHVAMQLEPDPAARAKTLKKQAEELPSRRLGTPEEIARVLVTVASSPFTNGTVVHVNGGRFLV